jgi:hypothetical protein
MTAKTIEVRWLNVQKDFDENFYGLTMASEAHRRKSIKRLYPNYGYNEDEGPLENYIQAIAFDQDVPVADVRETVRNKLDPIFGDGGADGFQPFIWYLA